MMKEIVSKKTGYRRVINDSDWELLVISGRARMYRMTEIKEVSMSVPVAKKNNKKKNTEKEIKE